VVWSNIIKLHFAIFAACKESMTLNLAQRSLKVIHFGGNRNNVPHLSAYCVGTMIEASFRARSHIRCAGLCAALRYAALRCACKIFFARYSQSATGIPYINIHSLLMMTFTVLLALNIISSAL